MLFGHLCLTLGQLDTLIAAICLANDGQGGDGARQPAINTTDAAVLASQAGSGCAETGRAVQLPETACLFHLLAHHIDTLPQPLPEPVGACSFVQHEDPGGKQTEAMAGGQGTSQQRCVPQADGEGSESFCNAAAGAGASASAVQEILASFVAHLRHAALHVGCVGLSRADELVSHSSGLDDAGSNGTVELGAEQATILLRADRNARPAPLEGAGEAHDAADSRGSALSCLEAIFQVCSTSA
jgi:hypothetical protein